MVKVTLAKYWSPEDVVYPPGSVVEVDEETAHWLEACGALVDPSAKTAVKKPVEKPKPDPEPEPKAAAPAAEAERPVRAASIDDWRKYAESLGIVTKGLSKKDIIAATQ
ncbi:hypothetical protein ACL1HT_04340 [Corynebacterium striatum]|nr:hypothetical protein [Corynebacterium striatum]HAT6493892.1 hypothetical protein [Corynebacterium striatum]HAT6496204.1 hypothetical protein [Corynebacterium striatum]HAT6620122.1 hypothetical protein [Corynebacterium striatum]HCG3138927.1 hypothetical protein [Corynebacterium striatum]